VTAGIGRTETEDYSEHQSRPRTGANIGFRKDLLNEHCTCEARRLITSCLGTTSYPSTMTQTQQWLVGQIGVLLAFVGFIAQILVEQGTAVLGVPWAQAGADGWAFWGFLVAAVGTAVQLVRFYQGGVDLSCHQMPGGAGRWVYPMLAAIGPLSALASLALLALEISS
jgi:hypothetical protein